MTVVDAFKVRNSFVMPLEVLGMLEPILCLRIFGEPLIGVAPVSDVEHANRFIDTSRDGLELIPHHHLIDLVRMPPLKGPSLLPINIPDLYSLVSAATDDESMPDVESGQLVFVAVKVVVLISLLLGQIRDHLHVVDEQLPLRDGRGVRSLFELGKAPLVWEMDLPHAIIM
uniref:Uncharacterized protein n=1 Tax=Strombidium inclinatum TaxID=197538 RepID=A0A7S3MU60_9SPIT|eukprot:CAMPEP_0170505604 /NCGR_PEP_ID=MMETSP0208-20121228/51450_1 /TAXON_ID=197538 /ORGANISM="Strombidium inclinatum, Strain S3" /LENGTH=170 /DNA_ID=CAMNT_0010786565 /DNA_START=948 /DNA_END=1460 /DNA_ORIENTATION=+